MPDAQDCLIKMILARTDRVEEIQKTLVSLPAMAPENGGNGEMEKSEAIEGWLRQCGIDDIIHVDSPDERVPDGKRPNIIARVPGKNLKTLWLFAHMDVVPAGADALWTTSPWKLRRDGDLVFGRGVEDNQQAIASMLVLAECLAELKTVPHYSLGLVFMADEECGSRHGLQWILSQVPDLFGPDDLYIVPDGGSASGRYVEVAEKAQLWVRFTVKGRQCHASMPHAGRNAFTAASRLVCDLERLHAIFNQNDALFRPPFSTFVPTRHDGNDVSINILPAKDVFYMDCRLLPCVQVQEVRNAIAEICASAAVDSGVEISVDYVQYQPPSSSPVDTQVMMLLRQAIRTVYAEEAIPVGIGGATVAAMLREKGLPAVVWSRIFNTCHQPDEKSSLSATCGDAGVFAHMLMNDMPLTNA